MRDILITPFEPPGETSEPVTLPSGLVVMSPVVFIAQGEGLPLTVELRVEVLDDQPVVTRATFSPSDGGPLTASMLARLAFAELGAEVINRYLLLSAAVDALRSDPGVPYRFLSTAADGTVGLTPGTVRQRRRVVNAQLLRQVAEVVKANPDAPNQAVRAQLFTSSRNASRWIGEARSQGYLDDKEQ
jgi:hypothetical protein